MKKKIRRKSKMIVILAMIVSFTALLSFWYMKNAHGYEGPYDQGKSCIFQYGYATVYVTGPDNVSTKINIRFENTDWANTKNYASRKFSGEKRKIHVSRLGYGGGTYALSVVEEDVWTKAASNGLFTLIDFQIKFKVPSHYSALTEAHDTPTIDGHYVTCSSLGDFAKKAVHRKEDKEITVNCEMSTVNTGLVTKDSKTYQWPSINMKLQRKNYKVTYDANKGTFTKPNTSEKTFACGENFTFPDVKREGYTCTGWWDPDNKKYANSGWLVCGSNYTEIAQWKANTYTVSYNGNGADSGNVSDGTATYDSDYTFASNGYTKKGYSFVGWNSNKNATTAEYSPSDKIKWNKTSNLTLYAIWSKSSYEVSFDGNGASGSKKTANLKYGADDTLPANTFERAGYTFMGWSEDPEAVKPKYTDGQTVNTLCDAGKTYELYAVWKKTDGSFDTHNIIRDDGMFNGSIELEGQNGTGFLREHTDSEYARIDKDGQPGYFTDRYK